MFTFLMFTKPFRPNSLQTSQRNLGDCPFQHSDKDKITFVKAMNRFNWALLEIIVKFFTASLCLL